MNVNVNVVESGRREVEDIRWKVEGGRWKGRSEMEDGRWEMGDGGLRQFKLNHSPSMLEAGFAHGAKLKLFWEMEDRRWDCWLKVERGRWKIVGGKWKAGGGRELLIESLLPLSTYLLPRTGEF